MSISEVHFTRFDGARLAEGTAASVAKISRCNKYVGADKVGVLEINWELRLSSDILEMKENAKQCNQMQVTDKQ